MSRDETGTSYKSRNRLKVLELICELPSEANPYCWIHVVEQAQALSRFCDVVIVSPVKSPPPLPRRARERKHLGESAPYTGRIGGATFFQPRYTDLPRGSFRFNDYSRVASILACVARERLRVDLVHAHFAYWPGFAGGILGKLLRKPVLLTVYGSDIHQQTRPDFPIPLWRERALAALRMSDRVIAVSNSLQQMVDSLGYGHKTTMISMGFVGDRFRLLDQQACRQRLGLPVGRRILLYVGNMVEVKGTDIVVDAFGRLCRERDDLMLVLVGDGPLRSELENAVQRRGWSERVRFEGRKPPHEICNYLNAADLLVVPSRNEGRPASVMEAMACGRPVVASRVGGIPELVSDESLGTLVEPESPIELARAISTTLSRSWDRQCLREHAQQFAWSRIVPQVHRLYVEVIG